MCLISPVSTDNLFTHDLVPRRNCLLDLFYTLRPKLQFIYHRSFKNNLRPSYHCVQYVTTFINLFYNRYYGILPLSHGLFEIEIFQNFIKIKKKQQPTWTVLLHSLYSSLFLSDKTFVWNFFHLSCVSTYRKTRPSNRPGVEEYYMFWLFQQFIIKKFSGVYFTTKFPVIVLYQYRG